MTTASKKLPTGSHILYFYDSLDKYIDNVVSFILSGIELGEAVIITDSRERYHLILEKLDGLTGDGIHYIDNLNFFGMHQEFDLERVLISLMKEVQPFLIANKPIRFWGHVDWTPQENVLEDLRNLECSCDVTVSELGFTTVCAYDGNRVNANILIEMLKCHQYLMTDELYTRSQLYKTSNEHNPTAFPTLSAQRNIDSEMDFYKQKLDFVHVVSHEVRNPLTVINAYAKILADEEVNPIKLEKLQAIQNNVTVIDNEISHIINTEEMLSTDALWQKKLVLIRSAIDDVIVTMTVKAETQNRMIQTSLDFTGKEVILGSLLGFKLILSNLLSNAIKYSYEGTAIQVRGKSYERCFVIEVEDEGIGMTDVQMAKLFIKYEKMNLESSGQGIGLFMVKQLVDHFKGSIEARSKHLVGSKFTVTIPLHN